MLISIGRHRPRCRSVRVHGFGLWRVAVVMLIVHAAVGGFWVAAVRAEAGEVVLNEVFVDDPVVGDRASSTNASQSSRFVYNALNQSVTAAYHSAQPSVMLQWPLSMGRSLTQDDSFSYSVSFSILDDATYFADNSGGLSSISFGLVSSANTGHSRTGSTGSFGSDTFDMVAVDYFPNDHPNPSFDSITLTPTVFQSRLSGSNDAFDGIQFPFAPESAIANAGEVGVLPLGERLTVNLVYDGSSRRLVVTLDGDSGPLAINQVGAAGVAGGNDGNVHTIEGSFDSVTEFPRQSNTFFPAEFSVDAFGIMLWQDGFDRLFSNNQASSLIANIEFHSLTVRLAPEPTSLALFVAIGLVGCSTGRGRREACCVSSAC